MRLGFESFRFCEFIAWIRIWLTLRPSCSYFLFVFLISRCRLLKLRLTRFNLFVKDLLDLAISFISSVHMFIRISHGIVASLVNLRVEFQRDSVIYENVELVLPFFLKSLELVALLVPVILEPAFDAVLGRLLVGELLLSRYYPANYFSSRAAYNFFTLEVRYYRWSIEFFSSAS